MQLKSFGCSFIYGSDLSDCPEKTSMDDSTASKLTWPALLSRQNALDYHCHARPSAGNLQILEILLSNIAAVDDTVYVINWTWIERFSYISDATRTGKHPWNPLGWTTILPSDTHEVAEIYYRHIHSQFRDKLETLICIKTAIDFLLSKKLRFVMTYTDDLILETTWHTSDAILELQKYVHPYLTEFDSRSYWSWIKSKGFTISERWHPLEQAHEAAASLMTPVIDAILHKA